MFDMGFLELFLIGIIALIVLGPERLPKAARAVGLWIGKAKQGFESIKTEIDRELKVKELQQQLAEQKAELEAELNVDSGLSSLKEQLNQTINTIHSETASLKQEIDSPTHNAAQNLSKNTVQAATKDQLDTKK